jgi:ParB/RepB/Spo0J family partition protein
MAFHTIPLRDILLDGPEFDTFIFTYPLEAAPLSASIQTVGLLNPVRLREHERGWQIVCGARRVLAFQKLGRKEIPARTMKRTGCSDEQALLMSLADNAPRQWNPVEQARVLYKFHHLCQWDLERLARELAPQLGLPPALEMVQKYLALLFFEDDVLLALAKGALSPAHAFLLIPLSSSERSAIFQDVIQRCSPSLNECREIIDALLDLKVILKKSLPEILQMPVLVDALHSPGKSAREKNRLLREQLRRRRFPRLSQLKDQFEEQIKALPLNHRTQIRHAPYFESNHLEIHLRADTDHDLRAALAQLHAAASRGGFQPLFDLVKGGGR